MFRIGEFSRITGLSIKALHLYHEKGILIPHTVDGATGYRFYTHEDAERARIVRQLKEMEFSLADIQSLLDSEPEEILEKLAAHQIALTRKIEDYAQIITTLEMIISNEKEAQWTMGQQNYAVEEKNVDAILMAGIRFKGRYGDCGTYFGQIYKKMGWLACGKPFNLYYDQEYKEEDADIESCIPVRKMKEVAGVNLRTLPGGRCVSLIHQGPYDQLDRSYEKIMTYIQEKGYAIQGPTREIYQKGPGMLFRGNPKNYLTEIQLFVEG